MNRNNKFKNWAKGIAAVLLLFFVYFAGYTVGNREGRNYSPPNYLKNAENANNSDVDFALFWQAWNKARELYIGKSVPEEMLYGAISGMVQSLGDPYSVFLRPADSQKLANDLSGKFDGIGAELTTQNEEIVVVSPLAGSPSEKAGLKPKDIIIKIDSESTKNLSLDQAVDKIRGESGTEVKLTVTRSKVTDPIEIAIIRSTIEIPSVTLKIESYQGKKLAILKIIQFGDDTVNLATKYANEIKSSEVDGIILDLRNDPGGYLDSSIKISGLFIDKGSVAVSEVDKNGGKKEYKTTGIPLLPGHPMVAIINSGTASAAEIVTGALRDHRRASTIGEKTFGKGSVQVLEPMLFGSSLKITIAKWLTPKGDEINGIGITPDVEIKNDNTDNDLQLNKARDLIIEKINK